MGDGRSPSVDPRADGARPRRTRSRELLLSPGPRCRERRASPQERSFPRARHVQPGRALPHVRLPRLPTARRDHLLGRFDRPASDRPRGERRRVRADHPADRWNPRGGRHVANAPRSRSFPLLFHSDESLLLPVPLRRSSGHWPESSRAIRVPPTRADPKASLAGDAGRCLRDKLAHQEPRLPSRLRRRGPAHSVARLRADEAMGARRLCRRRRGHGLRLQDLVQSSERNQAFSRSSRASGVLRSARRPTRPAELASNHWRPPTRRRDPADPGPRRSRGCPLALSLAPTGEASFLCASRGMDAGAPRLFQSLHLAQLLLSRVRLPSHVLRSLRPGPRASPEPGLAPAGPSSDRSSVSGRARGLRGVHRRHFDRGDDEARGHADRVDPGERRVRPANDRARRFRGVRRRVGGLPRLEPGVPLLREALRIQRHNPAHRKTPRFSPPHQNTLQPPGR